MNFEEAIINEDILNIKKCIKEGSSTWAFNINKPLSTGFPPITEVITPNIGLKLNRIPEPNHTILKLLLDSGCGCNVNQKGEFPSNTALIQASFFGFKKTVELLLKNGANINDQNAEGATALMMATYGNKVDIVKFLLKNGADKNIKTFNLGMIALDGALRNNNHTLIKLLK